MPENRIKTEKQHLSVHAVLKLLLFSIVLFIITFPNLSLTYSIGVDPSLKFLFTHLFANDFQAGRHIIFPHGPLAFFMYPLKETVGLAMPVWFLLSVSLVFQIYTLLGTNQKWRWIITAAVSFYILNVANFNLLVLSNVMLALFPATGKTTSARPYYGLFLTALAVFVKAQMAITCGMLSVAWIVGHYALHRNLRQLLVYVAALAGFIMGFWLLMYGTFTDMIGYGIGLINLSGDNSAAAAYYPDNNWWWLSLFLVTVLSLPWLQKDKQSRILCWILLPLFFASWKYAMAREEFYRFTALIHVVSISFIVLAILVPRRRSLNISLGLLATLALLANFPNVEQHRPHRLLTNGWANVRKMSAQLLHYKTETQPAIQRNIASKKLPAEVRELIGSSPVDLYPWDYTIIAANELKLRPRPVLQSYAAYTSGLDRRNARHFMSDKAPEFFIWDFRKVWPPLNGGTMHSIDYRYLLNDEPHTLEQLLSHYQLVSNTGNFLVYQKRGRPPWRSSRS